MEKARLNVTVAVFAFDPDPATPPGRGLKLLSTGGGLPTGEVKPKEPLVDAARRVVEEAGLNLPGRSVRGMMQLVGVDDRSDGGRVVTCWYAVTVPYEPVEEPGAWTPVSRGGKGSVSGSELARVAVQRLRRDTRYLAGAVELLAEVFTTDDLMRLHTAVHGRIEGSERTFRRRVQELRDSGVLRSVRKSEVAGIRRREPRFRSSLGTGGRPPELLRYSGSGGEEESLSDLRSRRASS